VIVGMSTRSEPAVCALEEFALILGGGFVYYCHVEHPIRYL
jgi:hypothetical protein